MQGCKVFIVLAGLGLSLLAGGCQAAGKGMATAGSGPSPTFGQKFAPPQSEPPVDEADAGRKTAARSASSVSAAIDGDDSSPAARPRARWLAGSSKDPERKALPVSARTDSIADDDSDRRSSVE